MSNTVLAVVELDRFPEEVASRAARIASRLQCRLELALSDPSLALLHDEYLVSSEAQAVADKIRAARREILDDLASRVAADRLDVTTTVLEERPAADAIIARALEVDPAYVVKGTEHHSPAERALFTYSDWRLIRRLEYPLWLVKPNAWHDKPVFVAAVDPVPGDGQVDDAIVGATMSLAETCSARVHLLHTYERLVEIGRHASLSFKPVKLPIPELEGAIRERRRAKLDALAKAHGIAGDAVHLLPGRTYEILPAFARSKGADLVVMGALSRSGMKRRVLGSTAERVLDHLPCDVLIVKPQ